MGSQQPDCFRDKPISTNEDEKSNSDNNFSPQKQPIKNNKYHVKVVMYFLHLTINFYHFYM